MWTHLPQKILVVYLFQVLREYSSGNIQVYDTILLYRIVFRWGKFVAVNPYQVIVSCIVITAFFSLGLYKFRYQIIWLCLGPLVGHYSFWENFGPCIPILHFLFCSPSNQVGTLIWSFSNSTNAQGDLLDLHGPSWTLKWTPKWTLRAKFQGTFGRKRPSGVPSWSKLTIFFR